MNDLPKTWQQLKERMQNAPKPSNVKVTCICGNHVEPPKLTDKDYKELFRILNGESQTQTQLQS